MSVTPVCLLDNVRLGNGADGLKNFYRGLLKNGREKALELINDQDLSFGSLYLLRDEFASPSMHVMLNPLYRKAIQLTSGLAGSADSRVEAKMRLKKDDTYAALNWMLKTGFGEERLGSDYDRLMERAAALLTKSFSDTESLPYIVEMIFSRNRSSRLIHELVWAFFEIHSPENLFLLAPWLNSPDSRDIALAKKLLHFIPCIGENQDLTSYMSYDRAISWLHENIPFLHYTGESLQLSGQPVYYELEWDAKYLCRPVSSENEEPLSALSPYEKELQEQFKELPEDLQTMLADFSFSLYRMNFSQWHNWLQLPVMSQISLAYRFAGGLP